MAVQVPLAGSYSSALARAPPLSSPCNQHHAVGQQRRRVLIACGVEAARGSPGPARWIVQFRARENAAVEPSCDQHLAVGQQRRRVFRARGVEAARGSPSPARPGRTVPRSRDSRRYIPPATSTLPLGSKVAVCSERAVLRLPVAVQVPLAGSYSSALAR